MSIPVHIVAGFLGSGKTTLMNHCLRALPADLRVAIIVNDFGKVSIDGDLIRRSEYAMKELASGCICCTLSGPLSESLAALASEQKPDVIVMETTGLAKPAQVASVCRYRALAELVRVGNVVCVVDGSTFAKFEKHFMVLAEQVTQSNTVLLNKVDLADAAALEAARARVSYLCQPGARIVETSRAVIDPDVLFTCRPVFFPPMFGGSSTHTEEFSSLSFENDSVYDTDRLTALLQTSGARLLRAKGIVRTPQGARLVQWTVGGLEVSDWPAPAANSRLVLIGRELDADAWKQALIACRVGA
jgi:G3E family GTPase